MFYSAYGTFQHMNKGRKCNVVVVYSELVLPHKLVMYSIICVFRNAVGPEEKFGLGRGRITGRFMFSSRE